MKSKNNALSIKEAREMFMSVPGYAWGPYAFAVGTISVIGNVRLISALNLNERPSVYRAEIDLMDRKDKSRALFACTGKEAKKIYQEVLGNREARYNERNEETRDFLRKFGLSQGLVRKIEWAMK